MIIGGPMVVVDKSHFDAYSFNLLFWKIKNTKSQYDTDLEGSEAIKGVRYRDDDRIARMVLGYIFTECGFDPSYANKKFISLNSIDIEPYIRQAILESARADCHYLQEKKY